MDSDALRSALLTLHKALLAAERENLERVHGRLSGAEFLQIVQDLLRMQREPSLVMAHSALMKLL